MLIELTLGLGLAWLFQFECQGGLWAVGFPRPGRDAMVTSFCLHALLIGLMTIATFIDYDEKTIPDQVTLTGCVLALLAAALFPESRLSDGAGGWLTLASPALWAGALDGRTGLQIAFFCLFGWWYAYLPKTLWYRGGVGRFVRYLGASALRDWRTPWLTMLALLAAVGTFACWRSGGESWQSLLSAWVGLATGGAIVWSVRIVGTLALRQEAMGFGDVTLLAMIGAFMGWQPALLVFFVAPLAGVFIAVLQWCFTGKKDIWYGPFLCAAALIVLLGWPSFWRHWGETVFALGALVPVVLGLSLLLMGILLVLVRRLRQAFFE